MGYGWMDRLAAGDGWALYSYGKEIGEMVEYAGSAGLGTDHIRYI